MATAYMITNQRSVLIVDDDPEIRLVLAEVFREEGFTVVTAQHGAAALGEVSRLCPDVIVLDVHMPVRDGIAFAVAYRAQPGPHAPIVVFSTAAESQRVRAIDPASVLAKPCDLEQLIATVERVSA